MSKPYPAEMREQAVQRFNQTWTEYATEAEALRSIAAAFGPSPKTLANWVKAYEDSVEREAILTENDRLRELSQQAMLLILLWLMRPER